MARDWIILGEVSERSPVNLVANHGEVPRAGEENESRSQYHPAHEQLVLEGEFVKKREESKKQIDGRERDHLAELGPLCGHRFHRLTKVLTGEHPGENRCGTEKHEHGRYERPESEDSVSEEWSIRVFDDRFDVAGVTEERLVRNLPELLPARPTVVLAFPVRDVLLSFRQVGAQFIQASGEEQIEERGQDGGDEQESEYVEIGGQRQHGQQQNEVGDGAKHR